MQNLQNDQTPTTETGNAPVTTLAEMLTARAEQLAEWERESAEREQRARETARSDALAYADDFLQRRVAPQLAAVLRITPAVDENALQLAHDEPDGYHPRAGYLMLDLRGQGIDDGLDDGEEAAADPNREDRLRLGRWSLRNEYLRFHGYQWVLHGPQGYAIEIPEVYAYDQRIDASLLDAIGAYPAWLASAKERAEAERRKREEKQAEQERKRLAKQAPHMLYVEGAGLGLLSIGHHLLVLTRDPRAEDGIIERRGMLEHYNEQWLLLNLDGHTRGTLGAQRLIPVTNVIEIQPLADAQEETAAAS